MHRPARSIEIGSALKQNNKNNACINKELMTIKATVLKYRFQKKRLTSSKINICGTGGKINNKNKLLNDVEKLIVLSNSWNKNQVKKQIVKS